ncbi:endonuclease/exonuclease/phosphatase [Micromonas pusilla CCMP1545]|uniref:Endonuclease/exonuclease/phosphatase n=1 Tax=Micromonas pusilla (strain CCMP1545) TaxID=564608 RepID=C1MP00_MICPC|nr:endonuclease/exonuclease/phosphatase [Micromonas pusilla CCMP1545]EEH58845.1 endonuclease/exonuclease/phosphatase [Micromonas pusilla CCMP1545]|eukprot:XP_003057200.1 endonuclease/exonuclease/phosphatase [Micromonas pusilla CCMP1545]
MALANATFALASACSKTSLATWTKMVEENGGRLVARGARLDADARVTHVVFVDAASHSTPAATRATIEALPFACRGVVPGRAPPMLLAKTWLVESCKRHARGEPPAAFESHELSRDASNEGGGVRAPLATVQPDADALPARRGGGGATKSPRRSAIDDDDAVRVLDALTSAATARDLDASRDPHDLRSACVAATLREACASLREYRPNRRMTSRADFDRFASQGYPGFVGRTCAARDVVEDAMGATWDARDASDHDAAAAFAAAAATSKAGKRRRVRGEDRLSTLPPEVLRRCLDGLAMLDVLAAAATCRGLAAAALGDRLATTTAAAAAASPPWPSRRGGVGAVRALRVMTWNLKNNDPDPSRRFANQPGAGAKDGGWHWHSRAPLVSRVIQNEKPHVLCVQEDMLSMTREVFASREMRAASCLEYSCFPSPVGGERGADDRVLLEANDDYDGEPGAVSIEIAKLVRSKGRWEQCGVWWRRDTFDLIEAGQFEWVDGRFFAAYEACLERGGGGGGGGGGDATWTRKGKMGYGLDAHMIPMTWALLRLKDGEGGESGASGDEGRRFLCCSTHIESGHDWSSDVPAKIRSSKCIRAAVGRLQQKFGADVPLILAGDLNQQKVQQQYRQLTGEGRALWRGMTALAPPSNAEKGKGGGGGGGGGASRFNFAPLDASKDEDDRRRDLVDVFDALDVDRPDARFEPHGSTSVAERTVRSGGHPGTTWHDWNGPQHAQMISRFMAADNQGAKHHAQLTHADEAELAEGVLDSWRARDARFTTRTRAGWGRSVADAAGVGGGGGGKVGGAAGTSKRLRGAAGHQKHIDHIYVARGDGVRDDARSDVQPKVRVVDARVVTAVNSERLRHLSVSSSSSSSLESSSSLSASASSASLDTRCVCGAAAAAVARGDPPWSRSVADACTCGEFGVWASDHFPVVADLRASYSKGERKPRSRRGERERAHGSPTRGGTWGTESQE